MHSLLVRNRLPSYESMQDLRMKRCKCKVCPNCVALNTLLSTCSLGDWHVATSLLTSILLCIY